MTRVGLLIVTSISKISSTLQAAEKHLFNKLYIQIHSPNQQKLSLPNYQQIITKIYASSLCHTNNGVDVRVIIENLRTSRSKKFHQKIDILLFDNCFSFEETDKLTKNYATDNLVQLNSTGADVTVDNKCKSDKDFDSVDESTESCMYDNVVLGGTFDRLHIGHKILLTEAVIRSNKRLVVGVTDATMVKNKKLRELILPVEERIKYVQDFLRDIDSTLEYEVVPIADPYGPTKTDPNLDLLVVSAETLRGGEAVNRVRAETNLSPLEIHCINLIESNNEKDNVCDTIRENKISSSNRRIDLLGTLLRQPDVKSRLSSHPYIIGLIGGIASGKSELCRRLAEHGAEIIDCDRLAHKLYEPGKRCYDEILGYFGESILTDNSEEINRKKLGAIVFNNPMEMAKLNRILWPPLLKLVKSMIEIQFSEKNCDVIVMEAAVLLRAGWQIECHEIWSTILSKDEAIIRLMLRNNLTETEAKMRIDSQESNEDIVQHSHVVFSSQYGFEFTKIQVDRAWKLLMDRLPLKSIKITN